MKKLAIFILLFLPSVAFADITSRNPIMQDEGTTVAGSGRILNFVGAGVAVTFAGGKYVITISGGGAGGAPTDADYLVGTTNASLSAEIVVGTSPGGELGGTWASPTVDATHSGSAHHSAVTLDVNADTLLSLSTQALGLDTQTANLVFAGPGSGAAAVPTFRAVVDNDIPDTITASNYLLTSGTDIIKDTHIDWGTGATQVSPTDFANEDIGDITITTGAWAVEDDSHAHTTTTVSGLDISDDTNLAGTANEITLTGDTLSLATTVDLGGKTSFEIPNGAANTVDTLGEVAVDSSDDQFLYMGAALRVLPYTYEKCFTIETPVDADDNIPLWSPNDAITITSLYGRVQGGTSVAFTISDGTNAMEAITASTTGQADDGTLVNNTFIANERVEVDFAAPTGTVNFCNVCVRYTVDRQ